MTLKGAIYEELTGDAGVSAIVGTKVFMGAAEQDPARPYVVFSQISSVHENHLTAAAPLARTVIQVDCYETKPGLVDTLAAAVIAALRRFNGTMGTGAATATVRDVYIDDDRDTYDPPKVDEELGTFGRQIDFGIWHTE